MFKFLGTKLMPNVNRIRINTTTINWLKRKGIEIPEEARTVDHIHIPKLNEYTELFTFKDNENLRISQLKKHVNKKTKEKTVQIREYDYIRRTFNKSKISEIKQKTISPNGKENNEIWRFYYAKDYTPVRFSHKDKGINGINKDNYLRADGVYTDKNGLKIRPISTAEYCDKIRDLDEEHFVSAPWTLKQSITTKDRCGTDSVQECTGFMSKSF